MREFFEALHSRIKGPLLGNFLVALALINWKSFAFLFFGSSELETRINGFESNISWLYFFILPGLLAIFLSFLQPLLSLVGAFMAYWPLHWKRMLQLRSDSAFEDVRQKLEIERKRKLGLLEEELIEKAKRDIEVGEIEDEERRIQLQKEIDQLRETETNNELETQVRSDIEWEQVLTVKAREILLAATQGEKGYIHVLKTLSGVVVEAGSFRAENVMEGRELAELEEAISELSTNELIRDVGYKGEVFRVTTRGYQVADTIKKEVTLS